jgi:hypothetical protein
MNELPMDREQLITHSVIAANGVDELIRKATWQNKVRKTRQKITDLLFEIRERGIPYEDEVMGLPIIETMMFLQSKIHPTNLKVFQFHTQVIMLSDDGVYWCNLVRGVINLFREKT